MFSKFQIRRFEKGAFYMVLASFFATFFSLFVKIGVENIYMPWMLFLRFSVPFIFVVIFFSFKRVLWKEITFKGTGLHLVRSIAVVISQMSLLYYFTKGSLTNGVLLWNTYPMFMPIISYILFRHKTSALVFLSLFVSFCGVLLILKPTKEVFDPFTIFGFISGFSVAIAQVLNGMNRQTDTLMNNTFLFFFYTSVLTGSFLLSVLAFGGFEQGFLVVTSNQILPLSLIIGFVGVGATMNQLLRGLAFTFAKPVSLAPFIYLSVVFSASIDFFLHPGTIHGFSFTMGVALIMVGSLIPMFSTKQLL